MINCLSYEYTLLENQAHQFGQFSFRIDHSFQNLNLFQFHFRLIEKIDLTVQILNSFLRQFQHLMALSLAGLLNVPDIAVRSQMVAKLVFILGRLQFVNLALLTLREIQRLSQIPFLTPSSVMG